MHSVSRRGFLVLGGTGAAGAALAACGGKTTERDESDDAALLGAALAAEQALEQAYASSPGVSGAPRARERATIEAFGAASAKRVAELEGLGAAAGGDAGDASASGNLIDAANGAIAAYRAAAGPLSSEPDRSTMIAFLAAVAAELAVLSGFAGKDRVPYAFVTGGVQPPNVAPNEPAPSGDETSTTQTTTGEGQ